MGDYLYTLRDDAPPWAVDAWPGEECEPMSVYDLPVSMTVGDDWHRNVCDAWEIVASVDHGLRAADETMVYECAILADIIMSPIIYAWARSAGYMLASPTRFYGLAVDAWAAACEEIAPYDGGWCEPTDDDPDAMRATYLHESMVWYRSYDQCGDVMVESSGDAGMTWFAVRVADGAR